MPASPRIRSISSAIVALTLVGIFASGAAATSGPEEQPMVEHTTADHATAEPEDGSSSEQANPNANDEIKRFCSNIADAARDRRYALQAEQLKTLQADVDKRIEALEAKRAEYEEWLKRREDFLQMAEGNVVKIYAAMKPDAAAERLAEMKVDLAAAILMKLDARKAGVILNEMKTKQAAALTVIMAVAARKVDPT